MKDKYLELLNKNYQEVLSWETCVDDKYAYLSSYTFEYDTYDSGMDKVFACKTLEVCHSISNATTFKYIEDENNYIWYLALVNMPFLKDKIEWGTSVRGAWWNYNKPSVDLGGETISDVDMKAFTIAMIEFIQD